MIKSLISAFSCKRKSTPGPKKRAKIEKECPICKSNMIRTNIILCGHSFCEQCIERHLDYTQTCPICRKDLSSTLLYPSKALGKEKASLKRVSNGVKGVYIGYNLYVKDDCDRWWPETVKFIIPNENSFSFTLIKYSNGENHIELLPQDSDRLKPSNKQSSKSKDSEKNE